MPETRLVYHCFVHRSQTDLFTSKGGVLSTNIELVPNDMAKGICGHLLVASLSEVDNTTSFVSVFPIVKHVPAGDIETYHRHQAILHIPFKGPPDSILDRQRFQSWASLCLDAEIVKTPSYNLSDYESSDMEYENAVPVDHGFYQNAGEVLEGNSAPHEVTLGTRLIDGTCDWTAGLQGIPTASEIEAFLSQNKTQYLAPDAFAVTLVTWTEAQLPVLEHTRLQIHSVHHQNQCEIKRIIV